MAEEVTRLADVRAARSNKQIRKIYVEQPEPMIDMSECNIAFEGSLAGDDVNGKLLIIPFDVSSGVGVPLCGLVFTKEQWEGLKNFGDAFYKALDHAKDNPADVVPEEA